MIRFARIALVSTVLCLTLGSCVFHHHRVGVGPTGIETVHARQWYIGFGLWRLNEVDTQRFAGESVSYDIVTKFSATDFLLSFVFLPLSVTSRTVTIDR